MIKDKENLRKLMKSIRKEIPEKIREKKSIKISKNFFHILDVLFSKENRHMDHSIRVMVFLNFDTEVDTSLIIEGLFKKNINVFVPKVDLKTKTMEAVQIKSLDDLIIGAYGIREPKLEKNNAVITDSSELDLVIFPGLAFNRKKQRLGYGGGFYDKFLNKNDKVLKIGISFSEQIVDYIPCEKHDVIMDYIITDFEILEENIYT